MKKIYEEPWISVQNLSVSDIIASSPNEGGGEGFWPEESPDRD